MVQAHYDSTGLNRMSIVSELFVLNPSSPKFFAGSPLCRPVKEGHRLWPPAHRGCQRSEKSSLIRLVAFHSGGQKAMQYFLLQNKFHRWRPTGPLRRWRVRRRRASSTWRLLSFSSLPVIQTSEQLHNQLSNVPTAELQSQLI